VRQAFFPLLTNLQPYCLKSLIPTTENPEPNTQYPKPHPPASHPPAAGLRPKKTLTIFGKILKINGLAFW
ncbi:MAG: hypothetical protein ACLFPD_10200, partial [Desulfosudaceae bacterium]